MSLRRLSRRSFLGMAVAVPFSFAYGCGRGSGSSSEALKTLIFAVGPWSNDQRDRAENFTDRYLASGDAVKPLFDRAEVAEKLVQHAPFRDGPMALPMLDLSSFTEPERELLETLVANLYSVFEVQHYHVGGVPDLGTCTGRDWYTKAPPKR
jgi:hypothetical protein